jgi:glycosyltransferase involved in cell wall biosynthesis
MNILFLTQILPFPPNAGPRVKTWHVIKHLVQQGAHVHLVTFIRDEEVPYLPKVKEICEQVIPIPIQRNRINDLVFLMKSILTNQSFLVTRDGSNQLNESIENLVKNSTYDFVHADQLTMAQFALTAKKFHQQYHPNVEAPTLIFDAHNATWTILERMQTQVPFFLRPLVKWEKNQVKKYEGFLLTSFDHTLAVTDIDKKALLETIKKPLPEKNHLHVIPIAVDTQKIIPIQRETNSHNIITLGTLHYPPNADGIRWFMREIFPIIHHNDPHAKLTVIGKNPPKDFYQLQSIYPDQIQITGYVEVLEPYLEQATVMVIPVLAGGGMRVRILEAFSRQIPVVTTTIGLEGIDAVNGRDVLVADSVASFAEATLTLLNSESLQQEVAENGRKLVQNKYDWKTVFSALNQIYGFD